MLGYVIIYILVTIAALLLVLRLVFHTHLNSAINRLKKLHQENLDREAQLRREQETAQEEHRLEVEKGKQEASRLREAAKEDINRIKEEIILKAREEAEAIVASGKRETQLYLQQAKQDLEKKAIQLSLELVRSTFSGEALESLHAQFVNEIVGLIYKLDDPRLKIQTDEVKIIAAFPVNEKQKVAILECLNRKTGRQLRLDIRIENSIIAGLIINMGELVLDASLKNRLKRASQYLTV